MRERFESIYNSLPAAMQNVVFSGYGYWMRHRRHGKKFYEILDFLQHSEWWGEEQIRDYQTQRLRHIIQHSYETVPYYQRLFKSYGLSPADIRTVEDLKHLPVMTKQDVKSHAAELFSTAVSRRSCFSTKTGGTTGKPLTVYLTKHALAFQWATWWRHRGRFGFRFGEDRSLMFGARLPVPPGQVDCPLWRYDIGLNRAYISSSHLTSDLMQNVLDWMNRESFDLYVGYPSAMYILAKWMLDSGQRLMRRPKRIVTGSDALLPKFEEALTRAFGAPVTEQYGTGEACGNISKCEDGNWHIDFELGVIEFLEIENCPGKARMVFTGLQNEAMPFLRYEIGDVVELSQRKCGCGRSSMVVDSIDGRTEDYLVTPDGRKIMGLNQAFEWTNGVKELQLVQNHPSLVEVHIVPDHGYSTSDELILERELRKRVGQQMQISFHQVDTIPRTTSGKYRAVVSEVGSLPIEAVRAQ